MTSRLVGIIPGFALTVLLAVAAPAAPALAANSGAGAATGSMSAGRMAAAMRALPGGQVLAAGGPTVRGAGPAAGNGGPLSGGAQLWAAVGSRGVADSVAVSPDGSRVFVTGDSGTAAYAD